MQPIRLSANLGFLWADLPLLQRIERAAHSGFKAIELHWPYDTPAAQVRESVVAHGLTLLSVNTPLGDLSRGDGGLAAQVGRVDEFRETFEQSVAWANDSGATMIHVLPGTANVQQPELYRQTFIENLQWAADRAQAHGLTILLEAINPRDKPGYFYHTQAQSDSIRQAVDRSNVKLMFDVYHVGVSEGDVLVKLEKYMPVIGHIQIAAVPSRAEPDEGEIRYEAVFASLQQLGYKGWVGCEYKPRGDITQGLSWRQSMGV